MAAFPKSIVILSIYVIETNGATINLGFRYLWETQPR